MIAIATPKLQSLPTNSNQEGKANAVSVLTFFESKTVNIIANMSLPNKPTTEKELTLGHEQDDGGFKAVHSMIFAWMVGTSEPLPHAEVLKLVKQIKVLFTDKRFPDHAYKMMMAMPNHYLMPESAKFIEDSILTLEAELSCFSKGDNLLFKKGEKSLDITFFQAWMTGRDRKEAPEIVTISNDDTPIKMAPTKK